MKTILAKNRYSELIFYRKAPDYNVSEWFGLTGLFRIQAVNNGRVQATDAWISRHFIYISK